MFRKFDIISKQMARSLLHDMPVGQRNNLDQTCSMFISVDLPYVPSPGQSCPAARPSSFVLANVAYISLIGYFHTMNIKRSSDSLKNVQQSLSIICRLRLTPSWEVTYGYLTTLALVARIAGKGAG